MQNIYTILLVCVFLIVIVFILLNNNQGNLPQLENIEDYRRGRRSRGRRGVRGWGFRGIPWANTHLYWPYRASLYSGWPPNLYGSYSRCVDSTEDAICGSSFPVKVSSDTSLDGMKDTWKCCRRF